MTGRLLPASEPVSLAASQSPVETRTVAVVITFYRNQEHVRDAVDSVLRQTILPHEIVVVDDASPTGTDVLDTLDPRVRVIHRTVNGGAGAARQTGVAATTADWIAFLDADDAWLPQKLERQFADLTERPSLDAHHTGLVTVYQDGREVPRLGKPLLLTLPEQLRRNQALPSATMIRRHALQAVGGWSADRRVMEDWELGIRLVAAGHAVGFLAEPLVRFRRQGHGNLSSRGFRHMWTNLGTIRCHWSLYRGTLGLRGTLAVVGRVIHDEGGRRGGPDGLALRALARVVALGGR
ncbi:MAG TPA: glycosyltransferase family 2 protein [Gemmatimonadales bacterium]|nr:glycosyltransferase family 2 protein [Gemmatimonadales bacterium]